jgi:hypothetical protein
MTVDVSIPIKSGIGNGGDERVTPHLRRTTKQAIKCTQETISRILKPHTYLKDDVVNYVTSLLRDQFDANISDTMFSDSLNNHGWWHGKKYFDFNNVNRQSTKPSIYARKLIMPIFRGQHWMLCVRYDTTMSDTEFSDWKFLFLDSLNSDMNYKRTMNFVTRKTSLHWKKERLKEENIEQNDNSADSYTHSMMRVPLQTEVECGSRLIVHMLLAIMTDSPSELGKRIIQLGTVPNLSKRCRQWVHDIVSHRIPVGQLPLWFPSTTISHLDGDVCVECTGTKYSLSIKMSSL